MGTHARIVGAGWVRLALAVLIVLVCVRTATAAAVECRHDLASAVRAAERAQEARLAETLALGGELCLVAAGQSTGPAQDRDGPHLTAPCPFFKSPAALPDPGAAVMARIVSFSRLTPVTCGPVIDAQAPCAAYAPRAPPPRVAG